MPRERDLGQGDAHGGNLGAQLIEAGLERRGVLELPARVGIVDVRLNERFLPARAREEEERCRVRSGLSLGRGSSRSRVRERETRTHSRRTFSCAAASSSGPTRSVTRSTSSLSSRLASVLTVYSPSLPAPPAAFLPLPAALEPLSSSTLPRLRRRPSLSLR